ncbi:MAG: tocopherol cyclase family protein [Culicoidibacterales bacterium]
MKTGSKNAYLLTTEDQKQAGYQWWWHSFTAHHRETKLAKSFFIQYLILNPGRGGETPQFYEATTETMPAYAAIKVGTWGTDAGELVQYYGTQAFKGNTQQMQVVIGEAYGDDTAIFGEINVETANENPNVASTTGKAIWNLRVNKRLAYDAVHQVLPLVGKQKKPTMDWHVEGMYTEYAGTIVYNDEVYDVMPATSYGYQDMNWGTDFSNPWVTLSCNNFKNPITGLHSNLTSLVVGGGRLGEAKRTLERKVVIAFSHQGTLYEYNVAKLFNKVTQDVSCVETAETIEWQITAMNRESKIELQFSCPKAEMLALHYENPKGIFVYDHLLSGSTAKGTVKLYEMKEKEYKLIATFEGSDAQCEYGIRESK